MDNVASDGDSDAVGLDEIMTKTELFWFKIYLFIFIFISLLYNL